MQLDQNHHHKSGFDYFRSWNYWVLTFLCSLSNIINTFNSKGQLVTAASHNPNFMLTIPIVGNDRNLRFYYSAGLNRFLHDLKLFQDWKTSDQLLNSLICVQLHSSIYYCSSGSVIHAKWNENLLGNMQISLCKAALPMVRGRQLMPLISLTDIL